jgi:uncharacterized lipoprotein YmbA
MKRLLILAFAMILAACSMPVTQVQSVDLRPTLSISNAPNGSMLIIDGITVGDAGAIASGKQAIVLSPGTHQVEVNYNGRSLISEKIYLGEGLRKTLSAGVTE